MSTRGGTGRAARRWSEATLFPTVSAVLLVVAALAWVPTLLDPAPVPVPDPPVYGAAFVVAAFVVAELMPLRIEVRRATVLVSLSEIPLVLAVLLMPAWFVGIASVLPALAVYVIRRDAWRNALLNVSLVAVEAGVAVMTMSMADVVVAPGDVMAVGPRFAAAAGGVLLGAVISAFAVGLTYRMLGPAEPLVRLVTRSVLAAAVVIGFALTGLTVWTAAMGGPVLCVVLVVLLALLYRSYSALLRQHTDLAGVYAFSRAVADAGGDLESWRDLLAQICDLIGARVAVIHLIDGDGRRTLAHDAGDPSTTPPTPPVDPLLDGAMPPSARRITAAEADDPAVRDAFDARGCTDIMITPLESGSGVRGYVEVRDHVSRWGRFSREDLRLLQTLTSHLAASLSNHRLVERLEHEAHHDAVTGLYNRAGLGVLAAATSGTWGGVLLVELNMLAAVNGALGHDTGERLLAAAGRRLAEAAGDGSPVGRIETDRFAVLLPAVDEQEAGRRVDALIDTVGDVLTVDDIEIDIQVVAGLAVAPAGDFAVVGYAMLLQRAELALIAAQGDGRTLAVYRAAMGEKYHRRFQLVTQFRRAVEDGRIILHYQPKLTLRDRELIGVEALVRWMHPEYGFVSPAEFVDAIENTGSIDILFEFVLRQALAQIQRWHRRGRRIGIAVNASVRNLLSPDFTNLVIDALAQYEAPAELLTLEITESSVMEQPQRSLPVLRELHAIGIRLSVDDFGTGYSSLAYLRRLPIDEIKIDKSFVQGMVTDLGDLAIVRAIIDLGHSLGLRVVAEGVEEEAGRDALRSMRCDAMQGFLLSRPLPVDRFETWLNSRAVVSEASSPGRPAPLHIRA